MFAISDLKIIAKTMDALDNDNHVLLVKAFYGSFKYYFGMNRPQGWKDLSVQEIIMDYFNKENTRKYIGKMPEDIRDKILANLL